jgi:glycosyltransferase involved in cell wall biosynthesis
VNGSKSSFQPDILCFSSTDWESIWGSRQQVMLRLSERGYKILFIEQMAGFDHLVKYPRLLKRKLYRWKEGITNINKSLSIISPPPMLPGRYYSFSINNLNLEIIKYWMDKILKEFENISPILWLYKPEQYGLIGKFQHKLCVYHCIDEFTAGTSGPKKRNIQVMEEALLNRADIVFANSKKLYEEKRKLNQNTFRIPSGADVNHFVKVIRQDTKINPVIIEIKKPRVGYLGQINERLNYQFLEFLATNRQEYSLVFIGDTYPWSRNAAPIRSLKKYPNVYFLGEFPYLELPTLLKGIDVCIIPYTDDEHSQFRSPLKLYEYLSAGKPIVSSNHPEVEEFSDYVYISYTPEEFVKNIDKAIAEDNSDRQLERINLSNTNSWDKRVDDMLDHIQEFQLR